MIDNVKYNDENSFPAPSKPLKKKIENYKDLRELEKAGQKGPHKCQADKSCCKNCTRLQKSAEKQRGKVRFLLEHGGLLLECLSYRHRFDSWAIQPRTQTIVLYNKFDST